jgi:hypothetical protein
MTNKNTAEHAGEELLLAISTKNAVVSVAAIQSYRVNMRDVGIGAEYVMWISEPTNLTKVHNAIVDNLGVEPRAMAIRRRLMSRTQRAELLTQAMEIAIKRCHQL